MAYSFKTPLAPSSVGPVLLAANRLETRPRSPEFNRALRAEIRDPTWLLARQWQLHEFRAEDRGTPAFVEVVLHEQPLHQLTFPSQPSRSYRSEDLPLEAAVEAQPRPLGIGLRLQMGQFWLRQLRTLPALVNATMEERAAACRVFATVFPLHVPSAATEPVAYAQATTTPEVLALLALADAPALDGYALYQAFVAPFRQSLGTKLADSDQLALALQEQPVAQPLLSTAPEIATRLAAFVSGPDLDSQARQFVLAFHRLYLLGADSTSWSTEAMAYQFTLSTAGTVGFGATHYPGGASLPWYTVDQHAVPTGTRAALPAPRRLLATEVHFPGAPNARWWEFEDRRVDFGQVSGDPSDWGRMLLQEFVFLYQNDWFSVPYAINSGTVCTVERLQVTDVFGRCYALEPAGAGQRFEETDPRVRLDNDANRWRLFAQTDPAHTGPAVAPQLYLPATVQAPLVSQPVEQVSFRREEATNLVWAVESVIPDGFAGGLDGAKAAAQVVETLRGLAPSASTSTPATSPAYHYQLMNSVPENWLPFVPVLAAQTGQPTLEQGVFERQVPGLPLPSSETLVAPRTALLQLHPTASYRLNEHEVPPAGVRIEGQNYRARWYGGRTLLWFGRQRGPAQPGGSSGLVFDQLQTSPTP